MNQGSEEDLDCSDTEIMGFLEMALSFRRYPLVLDAASLTDGGIVSAEKFHCCYHIDSSYDRN